MRVHHAFVGTARTCEKCGQIRQYHRVEHSFAGDGKLCLRCQLPKASHRERRGRPEHHFKGDGDECMLCTLSPSEHRQRKAREDDRTYGERQYFVGIDGEGHGRSDHRYVMLAASNESGSMSWMIEAPEGGRLTTEQCLNFLLSLPANHTKFFAYAFNYDLTKILTDLDDASLYLLFRPELRARKAGEKGFGPKPVKWRGYHLNLQGTRFSVKRDGKRIVVWDLFKFFATKFVTAIKDWKVGSPELWERMAAMKEKRGEFDKVFAEDVASVRNYCLEECRCMAELARKLVEAHEAAKLKLTAFYGAGSSGAAMLNKMGIRDKIVPTPDEMMRPVACAFSGGRFEQSVIGTVEGLIYNRDISSAYPYHATFLPCLLHARWTRTKRRKNLERRRAALVRYRLGRNPGFTAWGPFPFRDAKGNISYPIESGGGWVWLEEYLAGERIFPHVQFVEAWVYDSDCDCQPFKDIPQYYLHRLKIGKEGPGIVIKLGVNSVYGKLAQSLGNPVFNSWIWAGMITSGCRAQVLDMLALHKDHSNLLAVATDGIFTLEQIEAPIPRDTGTYEAIDNGKLKPLGGWEEKRHEKGMFFARPGVCFPLHPTEDELKEVRARGLGKRVLLEAWPGIIKAFECGGVDGKIGIEATAVIGNVSRFCGAKSSISRRRDLSSADECKTRLAYVSTIHERRWRYRRASGNDGKKPSYGQWLNKEIELTFAPMPKRSGLNPDGRTLTLRTFPPSLESAPYKKVKFEDLPPDVQAMKLYEDELLEQPDVDYAMEDLDLGV